MYNVLVGSTFATNESTMSATIHTYTLTGGGDVPKGEMRGDNHT